PHVPSDELVFRLRFSQNRYVRIHSIRMLAERGERGALWWIIASLRDPDVEVRREAVGALGETASPAAVVPLIRLYSVSEPFFRAEIAKALERINSPAAAGFLRGIASVAFPAPGDSARDAKAAV
ncbi:MAG: HEAT repeat domain-containing protein, partial [Candidatus Micrarchaeota archaeon]